jgi:ABC-2 type transport system permease protein
MIGPNRVRSTGNADSSDAWPAVIQPLARALPTTHAFIAMRSVLAGHGLPTRELIAGAIGTVVLMGVAFAFVVHMLRVFRRKGLVTRFS